MSQQPLIPEAFCQKQTPASAKTQQQNNSAHLAADEETRFHLVDTTERIEQELCVLKLKSLAQQVQSHPQCDKPMGLGDLGEK